MTVFALLADKCNRNGMTIKACATENMASGVSVK